MFKLKICKVCGKYTLKQEHCNKPTIQAGYKYIQYNSKGIFIERKEDHPKHILKDNK